MTLESDLNLVIKTIDNLSSRKNRPNLPAIARFLSEEHGFPSDKTINLVEELLSQNRLEEIVYKGNISFRNMLSWRQPSKTILKKLDAQVNSSFVVSTMLRLLVEDHGEGDGGIAETRLQSSLIEQLDGAVQLQEIRKQIQTEIDRGTLERNSAGDFVLSVRNPKSSAKVDLDMDDLSDSLESAEALESSPELTNEDSPTDNSFDTSQTSLLNDSTEVMNTDDSFKKSNDKLQNLRRSIENVVNNVKNTKDSDIMTEQEVSKKTKKQEITCQLSDKSSGILDNKRRRVIRKKKIYDPSEFEITPLVKRNRRKGSSTVVTVATRDKAGRGRRGPKGNNKTWNMSKDPDLVLDLTSQNSCESFSDNLSQESPKDKNKGRGRPPSHVNKKCSICLSKADKKHPSIFSCSLCLNIAHKECLKNDSFYEGSNKWRCEDCKIYNPVVCCACEQESNKKQVMLLCDYCEEFYHTDCHYPPVQLPLLTTIWRCSNCPLIDENEKRKVIEDDEDNDKLAKEPDKASVKSEASPTSNHSNKSMSSPPTQHLPNSPKDLKLENIEVKTEPSSVKPVTLPTNFNVPNCLRHKPDEPIPSVDDWTVKQVSDYFLDKFGQDVADAFQAQEIDGKLLKQMSRQRVTNDLGLQLGIALKVLYYVKKIQLGTNLLQQLWA